MKWHPIENLKHDEYVLGCNVHVDVKEECPERAFFIGRRFQKEGRLINEWTGISRSITHWASLPKMPQP